jgi:tRNA threonylcarbamoyladenosine modification (KEOPS) complex  Pcc1 subunit
LIDEIFSIVFEIKTKNPVDLKKILDLEIDRKKYNRSDSKIIIDNKKLVIKIFAKDIIAFKATINNYINLLELISKVYEVELK